MGRRRRDRRNLVHSGGGLRRDLWVGWKPNGIGEQKPHHYRGIAKTVWENRRNLPWAWRILRKGVCDGCALGVAGFHDWTITGVHLCSTRLDLLQVNTATAIDDDALADVDALARATGASCGRWVASRIRWCGARRAGLHADLVGRRARSDRRSDPATTPDRVGLYLTARGITNEVYYVAQKAARAIGTNNVDNAARVCHAPSTTALKAAIGVAATTCSYRDVIDSDLIVLFGSDVANGQPVFMKYLYLAKKRGAKIAVVNPLREPGLERYWVPSNVESAMFGTKITDEFFPVHTGGDVAFVNGVLKHLLASGGLDREFMTEHTVGFDALLEELERVARRSRTGVGRDHRRHGAVRTMYASAKSAVLVWSMGITQHEHGVENVQAIVNLGLARGNVGRPGRRAHADPRALGRAGRRRDGLLRDGVPRRRRDRRRVRGRARRSSGASTFRPSPGSRRPRWSTRRARRARRALVERRQLPRRVARARHHAARSRARRCASIRTSS